jgi:flagellin
MLAVIENATNDVTDMLQRMRELAVQAANDTNGSTDRSFLQEEVNSLISEVNRVANQTVYNNKVVLDGSLNGSIQVGTEAGQNVDFSIDSIKSGDLGGNKTVSVERTTATNVVALRDADVPTGELKITVGSTTGLSVDDYIDLQAGDSGAGSFRITAVTDTDTEKSVTINASWLQEPEHGSKDLDTFATNFKTAKLFENEQQFQSISNIKLGSAAEASEALATITAAIEQVASDRASYGALQNRLEYTVSNLMNVAEFTTSARSRIEDADFAAESARLAKAQVLQQTGTAMLAQANQAPQLVLQLIR